ncbi:hypothetical protein EVAR_43589_1 [Eumeta japonica]|uniref:Uncharacterized protein n=1 Tax=Eumeta variegata TaxID=151549 RepID=A0A4C1XF99_EUMVA|nr:hypothetical protein EVAR_43589_1 [Eumeta japonica]
MGVRRLSKNSGQQGEQHDKARDAVLSSPTCLRDLLPWEASGTRSLTGFISSSKHVNSRRLKTDVVQPVYVTGPEASTLIKFDSKSPSAQYNNGLKDFMKQNL